MDKYWTKSKLMKTNNEDSLINKLLLIIIIVKNNNWIACFKVVPLNEKKENKNYDLLVH